jgi:imidazolonepropionase
VKYNALSVDHLEVMTTEDIEVLKNTRTMPVARPVLIFEYTLHTCTKMIDEGLPLALASDFNQGLPIRKYEFCCCNRLH